MQETLLIRLSRGDLERAVHAVIDPDGRLLTPQQESPLTELAAQAAGREVVVLAPAEAAVLLRIRVPAQSRAQLRKAVPYAVEEHLTQEVERLHFAYEVVGEEGELLVAAVDQEEMRGWVEALEAAGIDAGTLLPEALAVPEPGAPAGWSLLWEPERWVLRNARGEGCSGVPEEWDSIAPVVLATDGEGCQVDLYPVARAEPPALPEDCVPAAVREANYALETLAQGVAHNRLRINLRQGAFDTREDWGELLRPWRAAAVVLASLLVTTLVADGIRYHRLRQEQQRLAERIEAVYRQTFPQARRIVNPRVQMAQKLKALRRASGQAGADFMELLARAGEVLHAQKGVQIEGLSFRDGRLELLVTARDVQTLDAAKQRLAGSGLQVEIQSASTGQGGGVKGRLRIQGGRA